MKRLLALVMWCFLMTGTVNAAELAQTTVKLNRMKFSESPLPILVTVKTGRSVVENGLKITVGNSWTVNTPIVSTNNLPSGIVAWPGIGTNSVNGQTIDFNSSDLNSAVTYGFYLTSGVSDNPATATEMDEIWTVKTISGGVTDASRNITVPLVANDQVTVTGQVVPKATDFQLSLGSLTTGVLKQNQQIDYEITYGSLLPYSVRPLVITASWSQGTIEGSPIATVNGLAYVIGSAGTAWGGVIPVVDLTNGTITWTINTFPANLQDQKINFSLKTNTNYTGSSPVNFAISTGLTGAKLTTIGDQKGLQYQYDAPPAPTPTLISTVAPTSSTTTTPVPTSVPVEKIAVEKIEIVALTASAIQIQVDTNGQPEAISVKFGNSIGNLNQTLTSINELKTELLKLNKLIPGKDYYFVVEVKDGDRTVRSDMFTFKTPEIDSTAKAKTDSIIITSQDVVIADAAQEKTDGANIVIPIGQVYSVKINLDKPEEIKSAKLIIRNRQVLGITSVTGAEPNSVENNLIAIGANGGFSGQLISPVTPGFYELYLTIEDIYGGINEQKIGNLKVAKPMVISDSKNSPIEGAKVLFSKYDEHLAIYQKLPSLSKGLINPNFSGSDGSVVVPLPKGKYQAEVSAIGFHDKSVNFDIGMGGAEDPPEIKLDKTPFSLMGVISEYNQIYTDVFKYNKTYYGDLSQSRRFFKLVAVMEIGVTAVVMSLYFSRLFEEEFWLVIPWLVSRLLAKFKINKKRVFRGKVTDIKDGTVLSKAVVYFNDQKVKTDVFGEFELELPKEKKVSGLKAMALGYFATTLDYSDEGLAMGKLMIKLERIEPKKQIVSVWNKEIGELVGGATVLMMWVWEVFFVLYLGLAYVWPFLLLAIMDLMLWWFIIFKIEKNYVFN